MAKNVNFNKTHYFYVMHLNILSKNGVRRFDQILRAVHGTTNVSNPCSKNSVIGEKFGEIRHRFRKIYIKILMLPTEFQHKTIACVV